MRGYFGVGVEGISKPANVGAIVRTAHAFGASFFFTIDQAADQDQIDEIGVSDTSGAFEHLPYYKYDSVQDFELPEGCTLVGVELVDESIELPSFRHPSRAAYIFGPEMGSLSPEMQEKCDHIVKIPMKFCVNVGIASSITMYDRMICMGRFAERPVKPGGPLPDTKIKPKIHRRKVRSKS